MGPWVGELHADRKAAKEFSESTTLSNPNEADDGEGRGAATEEGAAATGASTGSVAASSAMHCALECVKRLG
jgi:hypothetical protein